MPKFKVTFQRVEYYRAEVEVEAVSEEEAENEANEMSDEFTTDDWGDVVNGNEEIISVERLED